MLIKIEGNIPINKLIKQPSQDFRLLQNLYKTFRSHSSPSKVLDDNRALEFGRHVNTLRAENKVAKAGVIWLSEPWYYVL